MQQLRATRFASLGVLADGCQLRDVNNPDPTLRRRLVEGITIISGFALEPDADGVYRNGRVYDPGSGHSYSATVRLDGKDRLELRGYVGLPLFGRSSRRLRVGSEDQMCHESRMASPPVPILREVVSKVAAVH